MIAEQLAELVRAGVENAADEGVLQLEQVPEIVLERPRRREHGDWATNVALELARGNDNPRSVAEKLVTRIPASQVVERVEIAGPGFLNFYLSHRWFEDVVRRAVDEQARFGRTDSGRGTPVNVEYVSANPTGPINVVSGRHAAVGDAIARLLEATGHRVAREFYVNDTGRQAHLFGASIAAHYSRQFGIEAEVPDDGYKGGYVRDVARVISTEIRDSLMQVSEEERIQELTRLGVARMLDEMRASLERFGTTYDVWFSERTLHDSGRVSAVISRLRELGFAEEREGATWFLSSKFGDDKDRVLVRANGATTYLASDAAYLLDKFGRGFEQLIYLWGADHHGTVTRLRAVAEALGFDKDQVEISLVQVVSVLEGGTAVKGSKRAGIFVSLDELVDEVGVDAARYTFLTRSIDAPFDFDIELAKQQAPENPVFYVQYAHARICSILRKAAEDGVTFDRRNARLERLLHASEDELMRKIASYEEVVVEAAEQRAPHKITRYVEDLAATFSAFYRDCRVITDDPELTEARLVLCVATAAVIRQGLGLLGVAAPERM